MIAASPPYVMEIIPPRMSQRALQDVETTMQALASTLGRPLALELVGTAQARRFIARASNASDAQQLVGQLRARYPQAEIRFLTPEEDPLQLQTDETVSVIELRAGAAGYLPLRTWKERDWEREGADPLLGQLAALAQVPVEMRAIAQLALVAAPADWSKGVQRFAVEHPLERERQAERARSSANQGSTTSFVPVLLMFGLLGLVALWTQLLPHFPHWVQQDQNLLLHGHVPSLTQAQQALLWLVGLGSLALLIAVLGAIILVKRRLRPRRPIYDQRLVQEKTGRMAYRARLRLIVIGPQPALPNAPLTLPAFGSPRQGRSAASGPPWWRAVTGSTAQRTAARHEIGAGIARQWEEWRQWWRAWRQIQAQRRAGRRERVVLLSQLQGAYRQFHLATGGFFVARRVPTWRARQLVQRARGLAWLWTGWQRGVARSTHFLNVAECAALWHLPQGADLPDLGLVERTRSRTRLVPAALTRGGQRVGVSQHAGQNVPVFVPIDLLRRNFLAVAKSGKGKSTLLLTLALAALAEQGSGLAVIDPHGDLVDLLLTLIPPERRDQVVLVDLADTAFPVAINPLDASVPGDRDTIVAHLIAIFTTIWSRTWGSRMEAAFEMAAKTIYEINRTRVAANPEYGPDRQMTLLDIKPILTVQSYRHDLMRYVDDPAIHAWWLEEFEVKTARDQEDMISPVLTKMNKFMASQVARRIVGQPRTTVSLPQIVGAGQILLVRTGRGVIGDDVAAILGATLLGMVGVAMAAQAALPPSQRRRMHIIVDEFQTLPGVSWGSFLSELRKYQASFALATQALAHLDQIDRELRPTVMANIDELVVFGVSAEDARLLERELDGVVDGTDLINLDDFTAYWKVTLAGQRLPVFSLRLDPPPTGDSVSAGELRAASRTRLSVALAVIDARIDAAIEAHMRVARGAEEAIKRMRARALERRTKNSAEQAKADARKQLDDEAKKQAYELALIDEAERRDEEKRLAEQARQADLERQAEEKQRILTNQLVEAQRAAAADDPGKGTRRGTSGGVEKKAGDAGTEWQAEDPRPVVQAQVNEPDVAIDATASNGNDSALEGGT